MTTPHSRRSDRSAGEATAVGRIVHVDEERRLPAVARLLSTGSIPGGRSNVSHPGRRVGVHTGAADADLAHAERFVAFSNTNRIRIDAMWAWLDEADHVVATVLAVPNPGRTAIIFASSPNGEAERTALSELLASVSDRIRTMEVDLAQALLEPRQTAVREAFLAAGFTLLARLSYMERPLRSRRAASPPPEWPDGVTVEAYHDGLRDELVDVLDASYDETLDCPGLRGLRRTTDILAGHQGTGEHDPALWTILRVDGAARGALLLNPSPPGNSIELVYLGLARSARGRGLGRQLVRRGLRLVVDRPERAMTLAVDEANAPAIALYRREGFRCVLRRTALIRSLRVNG